MGPNVELETEGGDIRGNRNKCEIYNFEKISNLFKMLRNGLCIHIVLETHNVID